MISEINELNVDCSNTNRNVINDILNICEKKSKFHKINALNSKHWDDLLNIFGLALTAGIALAMTICTAVDSPNLVTTIAGSSLTFVLAINNAIKQSYSFLLLNYAHNTIADEFDEIKYMIIKLQSESDPELGHRTDIIINKYLACCQKSHIQQVKDCRLKIFCCFK
jgi:hypothetical protein